jgi:hypothetical protein
MLPNKRYIRLFTAEKETQIKISDLSVYCYRAYRDEWQVISTIRQVSEGTGLSKDAVEASDARLLGIGLLNADRTVNRPGDGLFVPVRQAGAQHWRHNYGYWYLYVRDPRTAHGRVSYIQMAVFSYLYHCQQTGSTNKRRWTVSYLASVLRCSRNTVTEGLDALATEGFLVYRIAQNRLTYTICSLGEHQLSMIQDATVDKKISVATPLTPLRMAEIEEPKPEYGAVVEAIARVGEYDQEHAQWLADNVYEQSSFNAAAMWDINSTQNILTLSKRRLRLEQLCGTIDDDLYCADSVPNVH